ncbi:MAG: hypothetical protein EOM26_11260 [Alphaproteobacteria bacterium]|nr:hypothetical protein [Alphaproteobacteria bacterium]
MATAYSLAAAIAIRETLLSQIVAGAGDPSIAIYSAADVLLASMTIDSSASAVDAETAVLTLVIDAQEDSAPATGTASYGRVLDGDGDPVVQLPCAAGSTIVPGAIVINTLSLIEGAPFEVRSAAFPGGLLIEDL